MRKMPQYNESLDIISKRAHYNSEDERIWIEGTTEIQDVYITGNLRTVTDEPYLHLYTHRTEGNFTNTRWVLGSYEAPNPEYAVFVTLFSEAGPVKRYCLKYDFANSRLLVYEGSSATPTNIGSLFDDLTWTSYLQPDFGQFVEFKYKLTRQLVEAENIVAVELTYVKVDRFHTTLPINYVSV